MPVLGWPPLPGAKVLVSAGIAEQRPQLRLQGSAPLPPSRGGTDRHTGDGGGLSHKTSTPVTLPQSLRGAPTTQTLPPTQQLMSDLLLTSLLHLSSLVAAASSVCEPLPTRYGSCVVWSRASAVATLVAHCPPRPPFCQERATLDPTRPQRFSPKHTCITCPSPAVGAPASTTTVFAPHSSWLCR